jgi:hypothetical protein
MDVGIGNEASQFYLYINRIFGTVHSAKLKEIIQLNAPILYIFLDVSSTARKGILYIPILNPCGLRVLQKRNNYMWRYPSIASHSSTY